MLTVDELRTRAREAVAPGPDGPAVRAAEVLPHLGSDDRNVRVAALRVLAWNEDAEAVDGILRGLDDPVKRVREVAAKSSVRFVSDARVVARLLRAVEEDDRAAARPAMQILGGMYSAPFGLATLQPVAEAVAALAAQPRSRQQALLALLRARTLTPDITELLRSFVRDGTKEEAVFATRRLDGFRIAHDGELQLVPALRATAEPAFGRVWFWVRVPDEA